MDKGKQFTEGVGDQYKGMLVDERLKVQELQVRWNAVLDEQAKKVSVLKKPLLWAVESVAKGLLSSWCTRQRKSRQNWRKRSSRRKLSSRKNILKMGGMTEMFLMVETLNPYIEKRYLDMKQPSDSKENN